MSKETGGTAFPVPLHPNGGPVENGMTLRDYIAIKAMQSLISSNSFTGASAEMDSRNAYAIADAMLEVRNK